MTVDRTMLRQALSELVRLRSCADNPRRITALLYSSALSEWARELGVQPQKLNKLVHVKETA